MKWIALIAAFAFFFVIAPQTTIAQEYNQGTIVDIQSAADSRGKPIDRLIIRINNGNTVPVNYDPQSSNTVTSVQKGDRVVVQTVQGAGKKPVYILSTRVRSNALLILTVLFVACTLLVARLKGLASVGAMLISFAVIFFFILPRIMAGDEPVMTAILGCCVFVPVSFVLSHGANKKTVTAIISTLCSLVLTGALGAFFVNYSGLTGFSSEEASYVQLMVNQNISIHDLLLAGIVIGASGILDDITISQSAIVFALKKAAPDINFAQLYAQAMDVGRDHIASLVNTLILVYAGASLPLLLLFTSSQLSPLIAVNFEVIAEEVVRTLVASIGLIMAVPLTTLAASIVAVNEKKRKSA